jgi:hypothetical protein
MAKRASALLLATAIGLGSALGVAACGEERNEGGVEFKGNTGTGTDKTRTGGTGTTPKAPTNTAPRTTPTSP